MRRHADIVIVGGGLVGGTLACLLGAMRLGRSLRIVVLDAQRHVPLDPDDSPADLRVSAISRSSQRILHAAGVWQRLAESRLAPYREMRVWDGSGKVDDESALHFDAQDIGEPDLGHIVENRHIQTALVGCLSEHATVEYLAPCRVEALDLGGEQARVALEGGDVLTAALVVGADGARSKTRELAGIAAGGRDYAQRAVVTHVASEHPHRHTAWQRFLTSGPLALLPLFDGRSSIVWSTSAEHAEQLTAMDPERLAREITAHSDAVLGDLEVTAPVASFPLRLSYAHEYCRQRMVLAGDAAHAVHPLAGQGVNLGYLDAAALAEVIQDALSEHRDIGDYSTLRRYARWRKSENTVAIAAVDGLQRLFGLAQPGVSKLRRLGLGWVNDRTAVKSLFIRRAMGLAGDLPRCVRETGV